MQNSTSKSFGKPYCLSLRKNFQSATVLCRTMIRSTPLRKHRNSLKITMLSGGKLLLSPPTSILENLWHELKEFIRREVKPHTKDELIEGIKRFWATVDRRKCTRY